MNKNKEKVPKIRFPGFTEPWEQRKLGEVAVRVTRKNKDLESTLPLTISAQDGLIDQNEFFNKTVASRDVSGYYLVKNGEFAYNKSYSNGYPWGAVKRLDRYEMGVLSTLYIVFKPTNIDSDFLTKYYDGNNWHKEVSKHAAEGARNHGLLNIAASDFFETKLTIPLSKKEQEQIGLFFNNMDNLITLHQRKLNHLKDKKKGLLQKMFPKKGELVPELRFPEFTDTWEQRKLGEIVDFLDEQRKPLESGKRESGPYPYYGASGIIDYVKDYIFYEELILLSEDGANIIDRNYRVCFLAQGKYWVNNHAHVLKAKKNYSNGFICESLERLNYDKYNTGTAQPKLNQEVCRNINIWVPKLDEQKKIFAVLNDHDNLITLHQRKLDHLKEQKKALLQQMFI